MALALIAGSGGLPTELVRHLSEPPVICALSGSEPDSLNVDRFFRLETLGSFLSELHDDGVREVCMAGAINRPQVDPTAIDAKTLPLVPVMMQALQQGDDGALRAVISIMEKAGFTVRAAHTVAPELVMETGCPSEFQPDENARKDVLRAQEIVAAMSVADVGQACVVRNRQALAIEGVFGTDWMLSSLANRPDEGNGGILFKAPKTDQDRRVDLPTIGINTVQAAVRAGLDGIVIEANGVIVLEQETVLAECNRAGLFLWSREPAS